ncbi:MAG: hypothetical protein RL417_2334 [Pseudomonadota bacterium]|jgi:hypothetical protein
MSFWTNDDSAARRREEERRKKDTEARQQALRKKAQRKVAIARQKERQRLRAEQDAEDKKLRDELVEKMLNGGKEKSSSSTFPGLNRGFGGERANPTHQQQCFKNLSKPGDKTPAKDDRAPPQKDEGGGKAGPDRSFPPLKRPF